MCELHPQWVHQKNFSRKSNDDPTHYSRFKEKVGKKMTLPGIDCKHITVTRNQNGNFYCFQCDQELKLCKIQQK